jgi:glycosyltransferase involved in cell wall biosynthesis
MSAPTRRSRSSSRTTDVLYVTAGDPKRRTGGNIYAQHMLAALRRDGIGVRMLVLTARNASALREQDARVAIVDTIAASLAARRLAALRTRGTRIVALALMSRGAHTLARRADRVLAASATLASELTSSGTPRALVSVALPGRDDVDASPNDADTRRVLCVANWSASKGIHTLLAAMTAIDRASLDLVGDPGQGPYAARVRRMLASPELAGRVRTYGSLGESALAARYRRASIFALPSTRESYGMALATALAHGLPSIACDIPATREVAGDAALLVPPGSVRALAAALRSLMNDRGLRERLRSRALRRARTFPTWNESEAAFVRLVRGELAR